MAEEKATEEATTPKTTTGDGDKLIPSYRLREETEKRKAAEERSAMFAAQFGDLETKYKALEEAHNNATSKHGQDVSLLGAGISDAEIRDFVRSRYEPTEGETFEDWLTAQRVNPSPLLSPFLKKATEAAPPATTEEEPAPPATTEAAPTGNPHAGAGQPAAHNGKNWGSDEIKNARRKAGGRGLGGSKASILAQLRAEGLIT